MDWTYPPPFRINGHHPLTLPFAESLPLLARNLPPSFFDSSWVGHPSLPPQTHSDLYSEYGDPWQSYMASMSGQIFFRYCFRENFIEFAFSNWKFFFISFKRVKW